MKVAFVDGSTSFSVKEYIRVLECKVLSGSSRATILNWTAIF